MCIRKSETGELPRAHALDYDYRLVLSFLSLLDLRQRKITRARAGLHTAGSISESVYKRESDLS